MLLTLLARRRAARARGARRRGERAAEPAPLGTAGRVPAGVARPLPAADRAAHAGAQLRQHQRRVHPRPDAVARRPTDMAPPARPAACPPSDFKQQFIGSFYADFFTWVNVVARDHPAVPGVAHPQVVRRARGAVRAAADRARRLRAARVRAGAVASSAASRSPRTPPTTRCRTPRGRRCSCRRRARRSTRPRRRSTRSSGAPATCCRRGSCSSARCSRWRRSTSRDQRGARGRVARDRRRDGARARKLTEEPALPAGSPQPATA